MSQVTHFQPFTSILAIAAVLCALIAMAIALGGPKSLLPLDSINKPFKDIDLSDLPKIQLYQSRSGAKLAFRHYNPSLQPFKNNLVLVHGSSASSQSLHTLAKQLQKEGYNIYVPDIRGHGESGNKGKIDYIGQLEDDLEDLVKAIKQESAPMLIGFSSGGGFALRFAGSARQKLFSHYVLLAPYLGHDSPTSSNEGSKWVSVGVLRIIGLGILNAVGLKQLNDLPTLRFALDDSAKRFLTNEYSYGLTLNFAVNRDYKKNIEAVTSPVHIIAGTDDELMVSASYQPLIKSMNKNWNVTLVPKVKHIELTLAPVATQAITEAVKKTSISALQSKQ